MKTLVHILILISPLYLFAQVDFEVHEQTITKDEFFYNRSLVTDIDGDGNLNILIGNRNKIVYLDDIGNNQYDFVSFISDEEDIHFMDTIDFNRDGFVDFFLATGGFDLTLVMYLSDDQGNYQRFEPIQIPRKIFSFDFADLNNDNDYEIYLGGSSELFRYTYRNDSLVYEQLEQSFSLGFLYNLTVMDLNNDGEYEIYSINGSRGDLIQFQYDDDFNFSSEKILSGIFASSDKGFELLQMDNDDELELVAYQSVNGNSFIVLDGFNNFDSLELKNVYPTTDHPEDLIIGDFDNDGDMDYYANYYDVFGTSKMSFWKNEDGVFSESIFLNNSKYQTAMWVESGDFDKDGDLDILQVNQEDNIDLYLLFLENQLITSNSEETFKDLNDIYVYPNPINGTIHFQGVNAPLDVLLYNSQGKLISKEQIYPNSTLNFEHLSNGVYHLRYGDSNVIKLLKY